MNKVKIEGTKFVRDTENMAILNTDINELHEYEMKRNAMVQQKNEINSIKQEMSDLKNDVSDIKEMLIQLIKR